MTKANIKHPDPEYARFYTTYPTFPGVPTCLTLLRSGKAKGAWIDLICHELHRYAAENTDEETAKKAKVEEIVAAFRAEPVSWVRILLLSSIAKTGLPEYIPLLQENLASEQEGLRFWAQAGLGKIDTKESRTVLWQFKQQNTCL